jgi:thioredoxin 1
MKTFQDIINSETPVLVDFFATWCGPCQMLAPILKEVKDSLQDQISIIKIDVDKNEQLAAQYQVRGVPTMMLFKKGKQLWRQSGVLSKEQIIQIIQEKEQLNEQKRNHNYSNWSTSRCNFRLFILSFCRLCQWNLFHHVKTIEQYIIWKFNGRTVV